MAELTVPDRPWERTAFSDLHLEGRAWLTGQMEEIGLDVELDAAANLIGTLSGKANGLAPIAIGSHSDTVPSGGRYDGVAGVIVALEIAQCLTEAGHYLNHPLQVIDFLAEEPNRFGISCVGSRAMVGGIDARDAGLYRARWQHSGRRHLQNGRQFGDFDRSAAPARRHRGFS